MTSSIRWILDRQIGYGNAARMRALVAGASSRRTWHRVREAEGLDLTERGQGLGP